MLFIHLDFIYCVNVVWEVKTGINRQTFSCRNVSGYVSVPSAARHSNVCCFKSYCDIRTEIFDIYKAAQSRRMSELKFSVLNTHTSLMKKEKETILSLHIE